MSGLAESCALALVNAVRIPNDGILAAGSEPAEPVASGMPERQPPAQADIAIRTLLCPDPDEPVDHGRRARFVVLLEADVI